MMWWSCLGVLKMSGGQKVMVQSCGLGLQDCFFLFVFQRWSFVVLMEILGPKTRKIGMAKNCGVFGPNQFGICANSLIWWRCFLRWSGITGCKLYGGRDTNDDHLGTTKSNHGGSTASLRVG